MKKINEKENIQSCGYCQHNLHSITCDNCLQNINGEEIFTGFSGNHEYQLMLDSHTIDEDGYLI